jgi:hypothetical protein
MGYESGLVHLKVLDELAGQGFISSGIGAHTAACPLKRFESDLSWQPVQASFPVL